MTEIYTGADRSVQEKSNVFKYRNHIYETNKFALDMMEDIGLQMWANPKIMKLWQQRHSFHAIIITGTINEIATPFLLEYKGVYITIYPAGIEFLHVSMQGNWLPLSVVPVIFQSYSDQMSFSDRAFNSLRQFVSIQLKYLTRLPRAQKIVEKFFPEMPPVSELYWNPRLTLINSHFAIDGPVPLLPSQVEVGTMNARKPRPLPQVRTSLCMLTLNKGYTDNVT